MPPPPLPLHSWLGQQVLLSHAAFLHHVPLAGSARLQSCAHCGCKNCGCTCTHAYGNPCQICFLPLPTVPGSPFASWNPASQQEETQFPACFPFNRENPCFPVILAAAVAAGSAWAWSAPANLRDHDSTRSAAPIDPPKPTHGPLRR